MKSIPAYLRNILLSVVILLVSNGAYANHLVGMDFYYTWISGNTYKITLIAYGDCGSAATSSAFAGLPYNTPQVYIYNGDTYITTLTLAIEAPSTGVEITPVCPADLDSTQCTSLSYAIPGIKKFVYSTTYTFSGTSSVWRFLFTGNSGAGYLAGRATTITNISTAPVTYIQLVDTLNNTVSNNSSPTLTNLPTPYFCENNNDNYNPGAVVAAGDSLSFFLVPGQSGTATTTPGGLVTYIPPATATAPLAATSFSFSQSTGQIAFYPSIQRSLVVYNIENYQSGSLLGTCQREMTFLVQTCTNPTVTGDISGASGGVIASTSNLEACTNTGVITFSVNPTESTGTNDITVTYTGLPAGATFTTVGNGTPTPHCTFSWSTVGVTPGSYTFYVTYTDNNCPIASVQTLAYTVVVLPLPTVSYSLLSAATCLKKAAISILPAGGSGAPWTIKVSSSAGDTIQSFTYSGTALTDSLVPGTYTITVYSGPADCKASIAVTIVAPTPIVPTSAFTNPTYCGHNDGTITLYGLTPGTTDTVKYSYGGVVQPDLIFVVGAGGTITLTGLVGGTYSGITVTYGTCTSSPIGPIVLTNPVFTTSTISSTNPSWCGICDGSITIDGLHPGQLDTVTYIYGGGTSTFSQLVGADSIMTITGLCQGLYVDFVVNTAGSCVSSTLGPEDLTVPPFTMRTISFTNPSYCGICNGTITLYGLHPGQVDTITYTLGGIAQPPVVVTIPADSMAILTNLCPGTYANFVATTGAGGECVSNTLGPVTLTVPPFTMRAISYTNPEWCGICNGTITLYGLYPGEIDTITYTLGGVAQPPVIATVPADSMVVISDLCAGTYANFIATTGAGGSCVSNTLGPVTLTVPPFTMRAISYTNPSWCGICDGTITLYGLHPGEVDNITYTLGGVAQPPIVVTIPADSMVVITDLCAGTYANFVATAGTGGICVSNTLGPVTLTVPPFTMRAISFTNPSYCGVCNGTVTLYGLHPGEIDTITYTYNGVAQPPVVATIPADSMVVITDLCEGTYANFVATTGIGGACVSNTLGPVTLTVPPFTMRAISFTNPSYCGICNGTITLYGLYPGETDTITYTYNGVAQPPVYVTIPADSMVVITDLCAGTYAGFVAKTGGICVSNTLGPVTLTVPPFTMRALSFTNPSYCGICNGTITLYGLYPGELDTVNYTYNGAAQPPIYVTIPADSMVVITGLCFGTYDNFVANTGGVCISNTLGPADLTVPPFIIRADTYTNPTECGFCNGTLTLYGLYPGQTDTVTYTFNGVATSAGSYLVNTDSTIQLTALCEGIYGDIVANTAGVCVSNALGPDTLVAPPIIDSFTYVVHYGCNGDTAIFTNDSWPAADLTYLWNFGDGTTSTDANPVHVYLHSGTFTISLYITNTRCYDTSTQSITLTNLINAGFTAVPDSLLCQGTPVAFTNTSTGTSLIYNWIFGDGTSTTTTNAIHVYTNSGTYNAMLIVTNYIPCEDTVSITLAVDSMSGISLQASDSVLCGGHDVTFTGIYTSIGNTGVTWTFSDGSSIQNTNPVEHSFNSAGVFTVSVEAFYRICPDTSASRQVVVFGYPSISLGADTSICSGSTAISLADNINAGNPAASWLWNTGATTPDITVAEPGIYYVTVTIDGCAATDSVTVSNGCYLDIPNAFTPNGDGVNDYFLPRPALGKGLATFTMNIYNRWGQLIFATTNIEGRGWDGRFNDIMQPQGVYIYVIDATFIDGEKEHRQGNVTLLQ